MATRAASRCRRSGEGSPRLFGHAWVNKASAERANSIERLDTPVGGQRVALADAGTRCRIPFTFDVLRAPSLDQSTANGLQTAQVTDDTQQLDRACPQR